MDSDLRPDLKRMEKKGRIIYIGDPLCSWCWGISPHLTKLKSHYEQELEFEILLGGLRAGGSAEWNDQFKNFLREHWEHVTELSGQPFGYRLFDRDKFNYDTEPPCRAVRVARDMVPEKELEFFKAIQYDFYVKNNDPNEIEFYEPICEKFDIDFIEFAQKHASEEYHDLTRYDFHLTRQLGIKGYPSILFEYGTTYYLIARGYLEFDRLTGVIEKIKGLGNPVT